MVVAIVDGWPSAGVTQFTPVPALSAGSRRCLAGVRVLEVSLQ